MIADDFVLGGPPRLPVLLHQVYEGLVPPTQFLYHEMLIPRRFLALKMQHLLNSPLIFPPSLPRSLLLAPSLPHSLLLLPFLLFFPRNTSLLNFQPSVHFLSLPNTPLNLLSPLASLLVYFLLIRIGWPLLWSPFWFGFANAFGCTFVLSKGPLALGRLPNLLLVRLLGFGLVLAELWLWGRVVLWGHTMGRVEDVGVFWIGDRVLPIWEGGLGCLGLLREFSASN